MAVYLCIDLKSFYASVECVDRGLDPLTTNLVVADPERTDKTICLAVSPSLKAQGVKNRCRVFEIPKSIDYIMATPRMQRYLEVSSVIYSIYLKYVSKDDCHVYSIDECFLDITNYLNMYKLSPKELGQKIMEDVLEITGITATCGIGTNLYLAKIALDITAKHVADHIGILDEKRFCETLWNHRPLTDFWRIGHGTASRLARVGINTMKDIAMADENLLFKIFGVDAELLIDHAWGIETATMEDIKNYRPESNSLSSGQVLGCDYSAEDALLLVKEMADLLCLDLIDKGLVTQSVTLYLMYSPNLLAAPSGGTIKLTTPTNSSREIMEKITTLYERIVWPEGMIHRINISFNQVQKTGAYQLDFFTDPVVREKEEKVQRAALEIKKRFGKNSILKGMNYLEGGKTIERNGQIGGHRSNAQIKIKGEENGKDRT